MENRNNIKEDNRFKQCRFEMWVTVIYFILNVLLLWGLPIAIGYNKPADKIKIVFGLPDWVFYGLSVGGVIVCVLPFIMVKYFFKEISLEPYEIKEKGDEK